MGDISMASPIVDINGQDAVAWLTQFASENSFGLLDPNADWSALMQTPAGDIQFIPTPLTGGTPFFPDDDQLYYKLSNGTVVESEWLTVVSVPLDLPDIKNGQDLYNFAVLELLPDNDEGLGSGESQDGSSSNTATVITATVGFAASPTNADDPAVVSTEPAPMSTPTPNNWFEAAQVTAYPNNTIVKQPDLGAGGVLTGYFLEDTSMAVLSIPSFNMDGRAVHTFSNTVGRFIKKSKAAGMTKLVIDLQQNAGGNSLLAVDAFKQFFPSIDPFGGSRLRDNSFTDALGNTFTQLWVNSLNNLSQENSNLLVGLPWAVLDYTDAETDRAFTSWAEFFGPHVDNNDLFSTVQRDNLSDTLFDKIASGVSQGVGSTPSGITIYGYGNRSTATPPPWRSEDILILTDGICQSSCALFVEMMHHEAGVATVVVGGRPNIGPQQAVAGTRGAQSYTVIDLDIDMFIAVQLNESITPVLPSSHLTDLDFWISSAGFNLRDQIRKGENIPLQFTYEAGSCRIYWTFDNFDNFSRLWQDAADALWKSKTGMSCVPDSTIFASKTDTDTIGPSEEQKESWGGYGSPTRTPLLPPATPNPTPLPSSIPTPPVSPVGSPVLQSPDGQPYYIASATPIPDQPFVNISTTNLADLDNYDDFGSNLALDGDFGRVPTLEMPCDLDSSILVGHDLTRKKCDRGQRCLRVDACVNGKWTEKNVCKLQCSGPKDCPSSGFQVCNIFDKECNPNNGEANCKPVGSKSDTFRGSCGKTLISLIDNPCPVRGQGYCERKLDKSKAKCPAQLQLLPNGDDVVVEVQLSQQEQDDLLFPSNEDAVVVPGSRGTDSVGDFVARPWNL